MASRNKVLSPPPLQTKLLSMNAENIIDEYWSKWLDELHRKLSDRNFQKITMASPVNIDARYISLTTTSAGYAITLEAPTVGGELKVIEMIARGGAFNVTMSLANCTSGSAATTCTWNSVGDTLTLISKSNKWIIVDEDGCTLT